ncbi:MFS transporter [Nocardiopsis sp. CNT-189]
MPTGVLADILPRRALLTAAPLFSAAAFALWTLVPAYPAFAAGFVLWAVGLALVSGTLQALVHDELAAAGAAGAYARLIGRSRALGTAATAVSTALAAPVMAAGGYLAVGAGSVLAMLAAALVALTFPRARRTPGPEGGGEGAAPAAGPWRRRYAAVLGAALGEARRSAAVRTGLLAMAVLMGATALDEFLPLLAASLAAGPAAVPLLLVPAAVLAAAGEWAAGRGARRAAPVLAAAAVLLAAGALIGHPVGMVLVGAAFGAFEWASVAAETRVQDAVAGPARATVLSLGGLGAEAVAVLACAGYGLGSQAAGPGVLFALAAPVFLLIAPVLRVRTGPGRARRGRYWRR